MLKQRNILLLLLSLLFSTTLVATDYRGRVLDEKGLPVMYATCYVLEEPTIGTATNTDGYFLLQTDIEDTKHLVISFLGYEKQEKPLSFYLPKSDSSVVTVQLQEQPIALQELVITASPKKIRNKYKQIAALLDTVFYQMSADFTNQPAQYRLVSDVTMFSQGKPWGMEEMIATIVQQPGKGKDGRDKIQFSGELCKRYFDNKIRKRADEILSEDKLDDRWRQGANELDSGIVTHHHLWRMGNIVYNFKETMTDYKHWSVSRESETETVLTYTEKHNKFLGMLKYVIYRHYIVDSKTYSVKRFVETGDVKINIPFGYKLKGVNLQLLNLLNMSEQNIEKFRIKKANATMTLNILYKRTNGHLYIQEKNVIAEADIIGTKKRDIPLKVHATQRVTDIQTDNVTPLKKVNTRVKRQIVPIY
ncbi:MAG: carboxypeptidase-like regulatory domain-containing protein [Paludibacteraceae bacterium]|nr:carboxypeptidase-like regulatory domain-containing protein [Paludibacteraceae bacterium]